MQAISIKKAKYVYDSNKKPVEVILPYNTFSELMEYLEDTALGEKAKKRLKGSKKFLKIDEIDELKNV